MLISLPQELRADVALRMAHLDQISPLIVSKIAAIIGQRLKSLGELSRESYGGVRAVSEMFNRLDSGSSKDILEAIEESDPKLVETIRHLMFVFEDLLLLSQEAIKEVLGKVDRKILTLALKGTSEQLKNHILQQMSQRGAEMLKEDLESLGPIKIKEVEAAQQQIIAVIRQLEADGTISLKGTVGTICRLGSCAAKRSLLSRWPGAGCRHRKPSPAMAKPAAGYLAEPGLTSGSRSAGDIEQRLRAAHQAGFEEGQVAIRQSLGAEVQAMQMKLARTIEELTGSRPRYRREAEQDVVSLALAVARRILHRELTVAPKRCWAW